MTRRAAAHVAALSLVCASCGAPLLKLPPGPGAAVDANDDILAATAACRPVSTISLEVSVAGSIGGNRARGRLVAGLTRAGEVRLEAVAPFGQPIFILTNEVGSAANGATLLLPRDNRVLERGQFAAVLEAVTGIPIDAQLLFAVVTGCIPSAPAGARALGEDWRLVAAGPDEVYLNRAGSGPWRLVATLHRSTDAGWRAEYRNFQDGLPRSIRLVGVRNGSFDVQLALSQVEVNIPLGPEVFRNQIPSSARPVSLDELKTSGPLGANGR
jgi:hypothetical protein